MIEAQLLGMIAAVYDAATDPALWPIFFRQYAEVVPADYICIQVHDFRHAQSRLLSSYGRETTFESYHEYYNQRNLWRERGKRIFQAGQILGPESPKAHLRPAGIKHTLDAVLNRDRDIATLFSVCRNERSGAFDGLAEQVTRALLPHLQRAGSIQQRLATLAAGEEVLNQLPVGVAFLTADARLVFTNRAAEAMMRTGDAFGVSDGRLLCHSTGDAALQHAIAEAAADGNSLSRPAVVLLQRRSLLRPLQVVVARVTRRFSEFVGMRSPAVVVLITDPEHEVAADEDLLGKLLRLSHAESRVAALLINGNSTSEIAGRLRVQENTVRAHLKSMFAKTGARNQAELIRLVLTSAGIAQMGNDF